MFARYGLKGLDEQAYAVKDVSFLPFASLRMRATAPRVTMAIQYPSPSIKNRTQAGTELRET
jgi:hypothetical protein